MTKAGIKLIFVFRRENNALFDASQYEFFGQNVAEEVEVGGLDEENDRKSLFGSVDNEYHLFEKDESSQGSDDEEGDESGPATGSQNDNPGANDNPSANSKSSTNSKNENRREKSLALLTQNFVKLFVCSTVESISLDEAAKLLLGDAILTRFFFFLLCE